MVLLLRVYIMYTSTFVLGGPQVAWNGIHECIIHAI